MRAVRTDSEQYLKQQLIRDPRPITEVRAAVLRAYLAELARPEGQHA